MHSEAGLLLQTANCCSCVTSCYEDGLVEKTAMWPQRQAVDYFFIVIIDNAY
jgi:hypothetical protein